MDWLFADLGQDTLRAQPPRQGGFRDREQLSLAPSVTYTTPHMVLGAENDLPLWLAYCCDAAVISTVKPLDRIEEQMTDTRPGSDIWRHFTAHRFPE